MKKHSNKIIYLMISLFFFSFFSSTTYAGIIKIAAVKNLKVTVNMNEKYDLPKLVVATMSNHTTQKVGIIWNVKAATTTKAGNFEFRGTIKGYDKKVLLTLKVVALPKQAGTDPSAATAKNTTTPDKDSQAKPVDTSTSTPVVKDETTPGGVSEARPEDTNTTKPQDKVISTNDPEILRAIAYGFVPDTIKGDWEDTITFSQYCAMLEKMLSLYDSSLTLKWEETASHAIKSNDTMNRDHGMLATYYAAYLMGIGQTTNGNWNYMSEKMGIEVIKGFDNDFEQWFPNCNNQSPFYDIFYKKHLSGWDFVTSSKFWCMGQTSNVSGNQVFDIDFTNKTMRPMDHFSRKEAIWAVLRLYESTFKPSQKTVGNDKKSTEILSLADNRRNSILNSNTTITSSNAFVQGKTYTGTAYYVANSGNDSNNGTSPETPWATMSKVNSAELKNGDAVFFKRGDIWYDTISAQRGVTYSAYGAGPKPVISGSVAENAAAPDKWKLYYSNESGEKIWVYYRDLRDSSGIFMNGGKSWANKVMPCWNGKQYVSDSGKSFDAVTGLTNNLDYFSCIDLSGINPFEQVNSTGVTGPLYLRCDAGNPGELYSNIEFSLDGMGVSPSGENGKDLTIDNLKIVFFGGLGVDCRTYLGWTNTIVQNCEIGWCGGSTTNYTYLTANNEIAYANISGGAVQMSGPQNTVVNNYIHHCSSKALVIALHDRKTTSFIYSDITIKGNLLEYNAAALHLVNYMETENPTVDSGFKNVSFEDNYVLYTGYDWIQTKTERTDYYRENLPVSSIEFGGEYNNKNSGIYIRNNTFYLSKYVLVNCYMPKDNQPIFSGNIYAQGENGWLAMLRGRLFSITENGEKYMQNELLDGSGTILSVK